MKTFPIVIRILPALVLAALLGAACAPAAAPSAPDSFTDPFAYCQAVGTIDQPDERYTGPEQPQAVEQALRAVLNAPADAPITGLAWRCVNGALKACTVGANLPCTSPANTSTTPTEAEIAFCKENPGADGIPAYITGHDTIYAWRCENDTATAGEPFFTVDEQGFIEDIWYTLPQP